jgi:hypothetical protein
MEASAISGLRIICIYATKSRPGTLAGAGLTLPLCALR